MRTEDITSQNEFVSSTQQDAVQNIQGAQVFNIPPDLFKEQREELYPEIQRMSLPPVATPVVARNVAESAEHAAAISPDAQNLSWIERQFGTIANAVKRKIGPERETIDLGLKKLRGEGFTEDDEFRLQALKLEQQNNYGMKDYGLDGPWESLPAEVIAAGVDMAAMVNRNKGVIASITGAQTALGAGVGAAGGAAFAGVGAVPGAIAGAQTGLRSGLSTGFLAASLIDGYETMAGSTYNALEDAVDANGAPLNIDEANKKYISHGVGAVTGLLSAGADRLLLKKIPFLQKVLNPKMVGNIVSDPAKSGLKNALIGIGRTIESGGIGAASSALQEISAILGEEIGNTYQENEVSFTNGLMRAAEKLANDPKTQERLGRSTLVGGAAAGTTHAAFAGLDKALGSVKEQLRPQSDIVDTTAIRLTPDEKAIQVLNFQDTVDASSKVAQTTKLKEISPKQVSQMRQQMVENDIRSVYFDKEELAKFVGEDAVKAEAIRNAIDPSGTAAAAVNAPARVDTHVFLDLVDQYPDLSEYVKLEPDGPSPNTARAYAEQLTEAAKKREDIRFKLGVGEKSPEERAYNTALLPEMDDNTVARALESKEVADAYLARLDVNEVAASGDDAQLANIAQMRERVQAIRETLPDALSVKDTLTQALDTPQPVNDVFGESDYMGKPTFTEAIEGVLSDAEVKRVNDAQMAARQSVVDNINETAKYEMNRVVDIVEQQAIETQIQIEAAKIANDPNLVFVDRFNDPGAEFYPTVQYPDATSLTKNHKKKGYSPFAIDPEMLNETQKKRYLKNEQLTKHKAFVKGGISPDDAATLLGVNGGENLLKILSTLPSREEIISGNVEKRAADLRNLATQSVDLNRTAIANAYHAMTANHIAEMSFMKSEKWGETKKGIRRIALPLPRIDELTRRAKTAVQQTRIGDLNANVFKVGERKSQRLAVDAILVNDVEKAFVNKEAAALNSELALATHIAIGEVNRVIKFTRNFKKPDIMQELKEAGSLYSNAVDEILDVFNFDPSKKNQSKQNSFKKFVDQQIKEGNGDFEIPERLSDVRQSINEMTVEEVKVIGDRLRSILHQAKMKNRLYEEFGDPAQQMQTIDAFAADYHDKALTNPDYNPDRTVTKEGEVTLWERGANVLSTPIAMIKNAEHILLQADGGQVGGILNEAILGPLKGIGKYEGQGESGKGRDMAELGKHFDKIIDKFGKEDWIKLQLERVEVPEFAHIKELSNGRLNKGHLFMMMLNRGNEGNLTKLAAGYKTDPETIAKVLDRELTEKHAIAAQQIMDSYKSYYPRVEALQVEMTGVAPEMVEAIPFTHKGKVYPGGYYPIMYKSEMSLKKIQDRVKYAKQALDGEKKFNLSGQFYADDMTTHRHTEARTDAVGPLNLSMGSIGAGFEMILHDLNFRKPIRDALKLVTHPQIAHDVTSIVGLQDYNVVVNTVIEAAGSIQMENNALFESTQIFDKVLAHVRSGTSVGYLAFNAGSVLIQPTSFIYASERMGLNGQKHILNTLQKMGSKPNLIYGENSFYQFAGEIHPAIADYLQGLDDNTRDVISKKMPKKHLNSISAAMDNMREISNDIAFNILGQVDQFQKVVVSLSAYSQFMEGDAPGFPIDKVRGLSPEERDHQAKVYASSIARLTLTAGSQIDRAPIQRNKFTKDFAMFFNDARNGLNNNLRQAREAKNDAKAGNYSQAALGATGMLLTLAMVRFATDKVRGNPTPMDLDNESMGAEAMGLEWAKYLASAPVDVVASNLPFVRDIKWAIGTDERTGRRSSVVTSPPIKAMTDLKNTVEMALQFMDVMEGETSKQQAKSAAFVFSYVTKGVPVNSMFKLYDALEQYDVNQIYMHPLAKEFVSRLNEFKGGPAAGEVPEEVLKALEDIKVQIQPEPQNPSIPENAIEAIRDLESQGNVFKKNPNSSAAGVYQFTRDTWDRIMTEAPELGLTSNGRMSTNLTQQEKAMDWYTNQNVRVLKRAKLPINTENIYTAHILGAQSAVKVFEAYDSAKLTTLVPSEAMKTQGFKDSMRVGEFKTWLADKMRSTKVADLDKPATQPED